MRRLVLASHGSLAEGMKSAAVMILGSSCQMDAFGLDTWGTPQAILEEIKKLMASSPDDEFVIVCDIKGGSACNAVVELMMEPNVSILSGMNLNLILDLALMPENKSLAEMAEDYIAEAREGIQFLNAEVMGDAEKKEDDGLW